MDIYQLSDFIDTNDITAVFMNISKEALSLLAVVNTNKGDLALAHEDGDVVLITENDKIVLTPDQADRLAGLLTQVAAAASKAQRPQ